MALSFGILVGLFSIAAGYPFARRVWPEGSLGERVALAGGFGLAVCAYIVFFFGLAGHLRTGIAFGGVALLLGAAIGTRSLWHDARNAVWDAWHLATVPFLLLALLAALSPPLALDWDGLAYHLALPKLWLEADRVQSYPYDHHSYFPQLTEMLFTAGHWVAGYGGAKLMHTWMGVLAVVACAAFAARHSSGRASRWSALAVAACPLALWEAGTAYIDLATALYTTLAVFLLADRFDSKERGPLIAIGLCAGLAGATKYTGLLALLFVSLLCFLLPSDRRIRSAVSVFLVGALVCSPWYVRTYLDTGNPVYPFAYEIFGGKYWSAENAATYRAEQVSFGVGRAPWELLRVPWDLSVHPERYLNQGAVLGALGVPILVGPILVAFSRARPRAYRVLLAYCVANVVVWFWLSQQTRYLLSLVPILAVAAGWACETRASPIGFWMRMVVMVQAAITFSVFLFLPESAGMPSVRSMASVALRGADTQAVRDYLRDRCSVYRAAEVVNALPGRVGLALYDEVLGYYFDKRYLWANPGHHTLIPYHRLDTGHDLAHALRRLGATHVLINLANLPPQLRNEWAPMLIPGGVIPKEVKGIERWRLLLAEAVQDGSLVPESDQPGGPYLLYRIETGGDF